MSLKLGTRFGPYDILAPLGFGGMGEVYRARDTALKRDVALKVMPADVASDPVRVARFQREAELVAALSHPGIAAIYGLAEADGIRALVLELVEGETLAERLSRAPLPLETALDLGRQLAVALDYAHERGTVHRDLKPSNIKLTPDGQLKVLDFGLAKAIEVDGAGNGQAGRTIGSDSSGASTLTSPAVISQAGMLLGTAAYMAPEQARGQTVDRRADIWAFGCVLFEMLTGRRAFDGETVSDTISTILTREPDWAALPKETPSGTRRLLTRCLQKDVRLRLPQIGVARLDLAETDAPATAIGAAPSSPGRWLWLAAAGVVLAAMAAGGVMLLRPVAESAPGLGVVRFEVGPPPGAVRIGHVTGSRGTAPPAPHMAVSPDGKSLAFVASRADGIARLWVRSLASTDVREVAGTDDASFPFWSPDGTRVAFFASARLKHVRLDSGSIVDVCPAESGEGGTWGADDTILFAPTPNSGIARVSADGGSVQPVTSPDVTKVFHRWPAFLADGRRFVYLEVTGPSQGVVRLRSLETGEDREVMPSATRALPVGGFLLYAREGRLVAQAFDDQAGRLLGEPVPLADSVGSNDLNSRVGFHATESGVLVHRGGALANRRLVWLDRTGREVEQVGEEAPIARLALSADGKKAAVEVDVAPGSGLGLAPSDLWFVDVERGGVRRRLTSEPGDEFSPIWSRDGRSLYYGASRGPSAYNVTLDLLRRSASGGGPSERVGESGTALYDVTPDGLAAIGGIQMPPPLDGELWLFPFDGSAKRLIAGGPGGQRYARFSADGRWLAYIDERDGDAIYVQPWPQNGMTRVVAQGGSPRWSPRGQELFYLAPNMDMMSVEVSGGTEPVIGVPKVLFSAPVTGSSNNVQYDVAPDGRRFLMLLPSRQGTDTSPLVVTLNWRQLLKPTAAR